MAKKRMAARKAKPATYAAAMKALAAVGAPKKEIGQLNTDGSVKIDPKKLETFKKQLGKATWSKVRFVALNAPFKRRSPISPT
jgi:hypothetical protein